jgi:pyruvate/2-oxoglutarate dehydrogenase complex dihydrolipoamide acyltransferase (E2) component
VVAEGELNEALDKLSQGIEESKQMVQQRTMELAQEYFSDSVETLKQQIEESRSTLEELPEQIPGADEGAFQTLFQVLMDSYASIEESLDTAKEAVANLDTERITQQGELDATDAARREAGKLGVDLTEVEGTGSGGRIIISDVFEAAERNARQKAEELDVDIEEVEGSGFNGLVTADDVAQFAEAGGEATESAEEAAGSDGAGGEQEQPRVTNAAKRKAEELGVDLNEIQGTGAEGLITVRDVVKG